MTFNLKVEITQETYENYKILMGYFRFTGLFPVSVHKSDSKVFLEFSRLYFVLGWLVSGFIVLTTLRGMVLDAKNKSSSIQLEADTDKLLILMQAAQYSAIAVVGTFVNPYRFERLFRYIKCINKVDLVIKTTYKKSDKYQIIIMALLIAVYNALFGSYFLYACNVLFGDSLGLLEVLTRYTSLQLVAYLAWVSEYINLVLLKSLEARIRKLNEVLALEYESYVGEQANFWQQRVLKPLNRRIMILKLTNDESDTLFVLSKVYLKLLEAADTLNDFLKFSFLINTAAVFWSLIYILYFTMITIAHGRGDEGRTVEVISGTIQLFAHTTRALLIVNPAHDCLIEMEKTKAVVCKVMSCQLDRRRRRHVDYLSLILGLRPLHFSACHFMTIDRFLLVSLVDIITTIIMVLYEHRNTLEISF